MNLICRLFIAAFIVLGGCGQLWAADNSPIAWNNSEWGNTDWGNSDWRNTDWGNTDWPDTYWSNTDWVNNAQMPQSEKPRKDLMKVTLGVKKPDGSCFFVVAWENSSKDAISAVAKNCQDCIISNLANDDTPGAENAGSFCQ